MRDNVKNERLEKVQKIAEMTRVAINAVDDNYRFNSIMFDIKRIASGEYEKELSQNRRTKKRIILNILKSLAIIFGVISGLFAVISFISIIRFWVEGGSIFSIIIVSVFSALSGVLCGVFLTYWDE